MALQPGAQLLLPSWHNAQLANDLQLLRLEWSGSRSDHEGFPCIVSSKDTLQLKLGAPFARRHRSAGDPLTTCLACGEQHQQPLPFFCMACLESVASQTWSQRMEQPIHTSRQYHQLLLSFRLERMVTAVRKLFSACLTPRDTFTCTLSGEGIQHDQLALRSSELSTVGSVSIQLLQASNLPTAEDLQRGITGRGVFVMIFVEDSSTATGQQADPPSRSMSTMIQSCILRAWLVALHSDGGTSPNMAPGPRVLTFNTPPAARAALEPLQPVHLQWHQYPVDSAAWQSDFLQFNAAVLQPFLDNELQGVSAAGAFAPWSRAEVPGGDQGPSRGAPPLPATKVFKCWDVDVPVPAPPGSRPRKQQRSADDAAYSGDEKTVFDAVYATCSTEELRGLRLAGKPLQQLHDTVVPRLHLRRQLIWAPRQLPPHPLPHVAPHLPPLFSRCVGIETLVLTGCRGVRGIVEHVTRLNTEDSRRHKLATLAINEGEDFYSESDEDSGSEEDDARDPTASFIDSAALRDMLTAGPAFSRLTSVHLSGCDSISTLAPLAHLDQLTALAVRDVGRAALDSLREAGCIPFMSRLTSLRLGVMETLDLALLANCLKLKHLSLTTHDVPNSAAGVLDLVPLALCSELRSLELKFEIWTDQANVKSFAPLASCAQLESIACFACCTVDGYSSSLVELHRCTKLAKIDFRESNITELPMLASLRELQLCGSQVTDLSPLVRCPALTELALECDDNITDLTPLKSCNALQSLSLTFSTELDLRPLADCSSLKRLLLYKTRQLHEGVELVEPTPVDLSVFRGSTSLERLECNSRCVV